MKETMPQQPPLKPLPKRYLLVGLIVLTFCSAMVFFGVSSSYEMHKTRNLRQMLQDAEKAEKAANPAPAANPTP